MKHSASNIGTVALAAWLAAGMAHGEMVVGYENESCSSASDRLPFWDSVWEACSSANIVSYKLESENFESCHICEDDDDAVGPPAPPGFIIVVPSPPAGTGTASPPAPQVPPLPDNPKTAAERVVQCVTSSEGRTEIRDVAGRVPSWVYKDLGDQYLGAHRGSGHDNDGDGKYEAVHIDIAINRELINKVGHPMFGRPTVWEIAGHTVFHELTHAYDLETCMAEAKSDEEANLCSGNPAKASEQKWKGKFPSHEAWIDHRANQHYKNEFGVPSPGDTDNYSFDDPPPYPPCLPGS